MATNPKRRRVRLTVAAKQPSFNAPEGQRAAWWRQEKMRLSRPALGELLGLTSKTIGAYERMATVPTVYRLACAALTGAIEFDWNQIKAKIGQSSVTF